MSEAASPSVQPKVVSDIMTTNVVTIREEDNLELIEGEMQSFRFRHMPVVDEGKLVGVVTHRDLLRASASVFDPGQAQKTAAIRAQFFVADLMTRNPITVQPTTPIGQAAKLMNDHKIGCLPVTDDHGTLVGIVTSADMVSLVAKLL